MNKKIELNEKELEMISGGVYELNEYVIQTLCLGDYVRYNSKGTDKYYDINEGNGRTKTVGFEDMVKWITGKLGEKDPRIQALLEYRNFGGTCYNGTFISALESNTEFNY